MVVFLLTWIAVSRLIKSIGLKSHPNLVRYAIFYGLTRLITIADFNDLYGNLTTQEAVLSTSGGLISYTAINNFLTKNKLLSIIRAHEAQFEGFKAYVWQKTEFPQVITIFSAPNYCGTYANKGAVIKLNNNELQVLQYNFTPKPDMLLQLGDAFSWSLPMLSKSRKLTSNGPVHRISRIHQWCGHDTKKAKR